MTRYMLDTNTVSNLVNEPDGSVAVRIARVGFEAIAVSSIIEAEIAYGLDWRPSPRRDRQIEEVVSKLTILDFGRAAARRYGEIRAELRRQGRPISANDLFIAAHALALGAVLVTRNGREFERVPGLRVEDWEAD